MTATAWASIRNATTTCSASTSGHGNPTSRRSLEPERTLTKFPILQFGASRFLQAHVDLFVSDALPRGDEMGPIAVAGTTGGPESRRRLPLLAAGLAQTALFEGGESVRRVTSTALGVEVGVTVV